MSQGNKDRFHFTSEEGDDWAALIKDEIAGEASGKAGTRDQVQPQPDGSEPSPKGDAPGNRPK